MKRKSFTDSALRMVSYIHETAAWADTDARVRKTVSSALAHGDLFDFTQIFVNQPFIPPEFLNHPSAAGFVKAAPEPTAKTVPSAIPKKYKTALRKGAPPLRAAHAPLHQLTTALPYGTHRAPSVAPFLFLYLSETLCQTLE